MVHNKKELETREMLGCVLTVEYYTAVKKDEPDLQAKISNLDP